MHGELLTIDDLDVDGRRVLLRCDLNVPLAHSADGVPTRVADDSRIRAALASIEELSRLGARLVLISDLGGPDGADPLPSMRLPSRLSPHCRWQAVLPWLSQHAAHSGE